MKTTWARLAETTIVGRPGAKPLAQRKIEKREDEIMKALQDGESVAVIAERIGVHRSSLARFIKRRISAVAGTEK
jgi:DNA-binding NarL/FixJ family response regulator